MKKHAQKAFDELKAMGVPVLDPDRGWGGHFAISAEFAGAPDYHFPGSTDCDEDGIPWADYYSEDYREVHSVFGVNRKIIDVLEKHGLYDEWVNSGVTAVHDI